MFRSSDQRPILIEEAAKRTGVSVSTIRAYCRDKILEPTRWEGRSAVTNDSLVRLVSDLSERCSGATLRQRRRKSALRLVWVNPHLQ